MTDVGQLSRRGFLYAAGLSAGVAALSACSGGSGKSSRHTSSASGGASKGAGGGAGSVNKPLPKPARFRQAPALAQVPNLPPVERRLPENPYVIPHRWVKQGQYGGKLTMIAYSSTGAAGVSSMRQFFYGHSPLRWLNDGLDIGPGAVDKWHSNADASEWTLHFRKGLRWSDSHLFSTEDVLFWWEDIVLPGHFGQVAPDDCRSGKNTLCKIVAVDQSTIKMVFDAPAPLVADRVAMWPNGGIGQNGPIWVLPKHYLKQYHPKYNPHVPKNWDVVGGLWETKSDWMQNPDCPTLVGYRCKSFNSSTGFTLERNPYYYAVTKDGDQLPYIDEITVNVVGNPQVVKLQVRQGKTDYCHGPFNQIDLSDYAALHGAKGTGNFDLLLWNSGSGTGSMFFLNYDYPDATIRQVFREAKFRQALSYAWDRKSTLKSLYFDLGTLTTGTSSPDATEFGTDEGQQHYVQWRDSYKEHNPAKAKSLLSSIGLKDTNGDGYVELPDGKPFTLRIDYSSDISPTEAAKDDQLVSDFHKIGIRAVRNPVPSTTYSDQWSAGKLMAHTNWEVTDTPSILAIPVFVVPIQSAHWAPLEGTYYTLQGTPQANVGKNADPWKSKPPRLAPSPGGPVDKLWKLYQQALLEPDRMKRTQAVWEMAKIHMTDGPFFMGCAANYPQVVTVSNDLANVPRKEDLARGGLVNAWATPCPASYDPECYYWQNPSSHT